MKKIAERMHEGISKCQDSFSKDKKFQELQEFYEDMKKKGIAKKQEYSLPQLDTIGHNFYQTT